MLPGSGVRCKSFQYAVRAAFRRRRVAESLRRCAGARPCATRPAWTRVDRLISAPAGNIRRRRSPPLQEVRCRASRRGHLSRPAPTPRRRSRIETLKTHGTWQGTCARGGYDTTRVRDQRFACKLTGTASFLKTTRDLGAEGEGRHLSSYARPSRWAKKIDADAQLRRRLDVDSLWVRSTRRLGSTPIRRMNSRRSGRCRNRRDRSNSRGCRSSWLRQLRARGLRQPLGAGSLFNSAWSLARFSLLRPSGSYC